MFETDDQRLFTIGLGTSTEKKEKLVTFQHAKKKKKIRDNRQKMKEG